MKKTYSLLFLVIFLSGCSQQLRTLITLSGEQNAQRQYIESESRKFNALLKDIKEDRLKTGQSSERIIKLYGEPITIKEDEGKKVFLYREPAEFNPSQKVYLYFDENNALINFELVSEEPASEPTQN